MNNLLLIGVVLFVFGFVAKLLKKQTTTSAKELTFKSRGELFTPAERSFIGVLQQAVGDEYSIFGKVRLGDLIEPGRGLNNSQRQTALNKINRKHIDFLICRSDNLAFVAAVELDDKSHRRKDRSARDQFVDQALTSAGIPIVRFPAQAGYGLTDVQQKLSAAFQVGTSAGDIAPSVTEFSLGNKPHPVIEQEAADWSMKAPEVSQPVGDPTCPACRSEMVKRLAKRGANAGNWFWACSTFPKCRKVIAIEN